MCMPAKSGVCAGATSQANVASRIAATLICIVGPSSQAVADHGQELKTECEMATWGEFAVAAPALADRGRKLFYRTETGEALVTTVRGDGLPRIHPIYVAILEERLVAFITESPKATDLATDGRFALHNHQDPAAPDEFQIRGRARPIVDAATRARLAAAWYFEVSEDYRLFEFKIDRALLGRRAGPDDWPPRYESWPLRRSIRA